MHNMSASDFLGCIQSQLAQVRLLADAPTDLPNAADILIWPGAAPFPDGVDAQVMIGDNGCWFVRASADLIDFLREALQ